MNLMNILGPFFISKMFWMIDIEFQMLTSLNKLISILGSSVTYYQKTLSRIWLCIFIWELKFLYIQNERHREEEQTENIEIWYRRVQLKE